MAKVIKAELQNFQSHKNSVIEFHKGLNVITGPSDSGKSAIIRAIKWVLYNEPRGSDFITANTNQCSVSLYFDNGTIITRERTATKNRYTLQRDGEKEVFEGFGNTVPSEIIESHQIRNLYLDTDQKSSINLAGQLEGPFLLSQSGAIKAKAIGRILGIHYLDSAARKATSTINELKREYTQSLEEQKRIKEELKTYKIYSDYQIKLEKASSSYLSLETSYQRLTSLKKLTKKMQELNQNISSTREIMEKTNNVSQIENMVNDALAMEIQKNKLSLNSFNLVQKLREIEKSKRVINMTQNYLEIQEKVKTLSRYKETLLKYKDLFTRYMTNEEQLNKHEKILKRTVNTKTCEDSLTKLLNLHNKLDSLRKKSIQLNDLKKEMSSTSTILRSTNRYNDILKTSNALVNLNDKLQKLIVASKNKKETELRLSKGKGFLQENTATLNKLLKQYQDILSNTPQCPICETRIDKERTIKLVDKWRD